MDVRLREGEAHKLADRLPDLMIESMRVSSTIAHGLHGRRRAGPGETFWQFRQYQPTDSVSVIDWRRSASSDTVFVREREWEAAHTIWLWPDLSGSMNYKSHLSSTPKSDRSLVLTLALAELLVRGGERVGVLGLTKPTASRKAATLLAEALIGYVSVGAHASSLPPPVRLPRFCGAVVVSDFLDPIELIEARLSAIASGGVQGHVIQVLDPAEESLPFKGRTQFIGLEQAHGATDGGSDRWLADRAESLKPQYLARLAQHKAALQDLTRRLNWSYVLHHTDRPASQPLLNLMQRLGQRSAGGA